MQLNSGRGLNPKQPGSFRGPHVVVEPLEIRRAGAAGLLAELGGATGPCILYTAIVDGHMDGHGEQPGPAPGKSAGRSGNLQGRTGGAWEGRWWPGGTGMTSGFPSPLL